MNRCRLGVTYVASVPLRATDAGGFDCKCRQTGNRRRLAVLLVVLLGVLVVSFGSATAQNNPTPTLSSIAPSTAAVGSGAFTLTATGTKFIASSVVRWNGSNRTTTFVSSTKLQAQILATDIAATGTASVTVFNPTPGGGTSSAATFTITATNPAPTLTSINPTNVVAGGAAFTLTATGSARNRSSCTATQTKAASCCTPTRPSTAAATPCT